MNTSAQRHRSSGILLHITSLPSRYGIGDLGPGAHQTATKITDYYTETGKRVLKDTVLPTVRATGWWSGEI